MHSEEEVILVDTQDQVIGTAEKLKAHQLGMLHRAFSIFIYRIQGLGSEIEFLLQQRHQNKYHCGGLWTNTCCSHPRLHEGIIEAGQRRLKEELGISLPLISIGSFQYQATFTNGLIENEFDHVLLGEYLGEPSPQSESFNFDFDEKEIQDLKWMSLTQLEAELAHSEHLYTPWLKPALKIVSEYLCCKS